MDSLLGLGSSNSSSRSCSPGRVMNPNSNNSGSSSKHSHGGDTPVGGGILHSRHRRKSPEGPLTTHEVVVGSSTKFYDEHNDSDFLHSSHLSNGSGEQLAPGADETDNQASSDLVRQQALIKSIQAKIERTKGLIRREQTARDDNVNEYLKLSANADRQQIQRIKSVFEKKNQKSAQIISQLQKKLEGYNKKMRDAENMRASSTHRQPREVLRDMGQGLNGVVENIKGGLHGAAETVMSKPREFAHLLKNKFGSADNINSLSRSENSVNDEEKTHHGSATLPGNCTLSSGHGSSSAQQTHKFPSEDGNLQGSGSSSVTSESNPMGQHTSPGLGDDPLHITSVYELNQETRQQVELLKAAVESLKSLPADIQYLNASLQEERFRCERLEEQVNDLTELHQNEVENLKQTLTDMEEKVQYQSEERLRDIHEMLEACHTKISKMEHQQAQHQQYVTLEGIDNSNARALVVKLINILLTILQVVLLLVATAAGILMPFLKTRLRILSTLALIAAMVFALKQWPELRDVGVHLIRHVKAALTVK